MPPPLNKQAKQATIENLLTCTSGIARQGSNEGDWGIGEPHKPGEVFHYNNWTFNALGGIFNQQTDSDLFKDFNNEIVKQIGMQDFNLNNTWYQYNNKIDMYPKYGFKMSARDMARFGLLYLNKGNWNGKQIIPEKWVAESTKTHVKTGIKPFNGYGYLWWTSNTGYFKEYPVYSALGVGENTINVCNKKNVVFITRVNTYNPKFKYVSHQQMLELLKMLLKAKINDSILNPELVKLPDSKSKIKKLNLSSLELMRFTGKYIFRKNKMWSKAMIKLQDNSFIYTNKKAFEEISAYPVDIIYAKGGREFLLTNLAHTDDRYKLTIGDKLQHSWDETRDFIWRLIRPNNEIRQIESTQSFIELPDSTYTITVCRDITENPNRKTKLDDLFINIINNLSNENNVITWIIKKTNSKDIKAQYLSDPFEEVTGYKKSYFTGDINSLQQLLHPEYHRIIKRWIDNPKSHKNFIFKLISANSKIIKVRTSISTIKTHDIGKVYYGSLKLI